MKVFRLTHDEGGEKGQEGTYCIYDPKEPNAIMGEINEMQYGEVGDRWIITVEEMSKEEFENLSEFTGW